MPTINAAHELDSTHNIAYVEGPHTKWGLCNALSKIESQRPRQYGAPHAANKIGHPHEATRLNGSRMGLRTEWAPRATRLNN